ncbi:MAG: hypothetical protein HGA87_02935 [Desulfobulbaceae bacterium]|nr:hypothetical protein [Desulfobulbaceae bacterium]
MNPKIISLYKYWCNAGAVKQFISSKVSTEGGEELPEWFNELGNRASIFSRLTVWYALLYVVVEGFQELNLSHIEVDKLLTNKECVDCLRLFRNATFHYQKDPLTEKALKFLEAKDSEIWIKSLNKALEAYFLENLPIMQHIEHLKGSNA